MRQTPMAYSPQTGYFYALGNSSLQWFRRAEDPYVFILGGARVPGMPAGHGVMAAIDVKTSKIAWKQDFTGPRPSGAMATATGLLFQTMPDGNLQARDAKTGEMIWQYQTGRMAAPLRVQATRSMASSTSRSRAATTSSR